MEKIFDAEFFEKLYNIKFNTSIKLNIGMNGGRKSSAKGSSVEFSDFREYMFGDDIRKIDWNAYGRTDKLFVKLFMEEKEGLFNIFLDCSKSMDYGKNNKSIYALKLVAMFSYIIINNLDRVYITKMQQDNIITSKGMTGQQAFKKILVDLENTKFYGSIDLEKCIKNRQLKNKGISIIISDFFSENIEQVIRYLLYKNQEIILIHILSREELEPDIEGTYNLIDSEILNDMRITMSSNVKKMYQKSLEKFLNNLKILAQKYHITYIQIPTDKPLDQLFYNQRIFIKQ